MKIKWLKSGYTWEKDKRYSFLEGDILEIDDKHFLNSRLKDLLEHDSGAWIEIIENEKETERII